MPDQFDGPVRDVAVDRSQDAALRSLVQTWVASEPAHAASETDGATPGAAPEVQPATTRQRPPGSTQEDIDKGRVFFESYRHAWCRDDYSGREGVLMDVEGRQVYLRLRTGIEFTCQIRDLVVLRPPPPLANRSVKYVGPEDVTNRPVGLLMEMWAVDKGTLAIVQPAAGPAWFALSADLESVDCLSGPVADWADPPFATGEEEA